MLFGWDLASLRAPHLNHKAKAWFACAFSRFSQDGYIASTAPMRKRQVHSLCIMDARRHYILISGGSQDWERLWNSQHASLTYSPSSGRRYYAMVGNFKGSFSLGSSPSCDLAPHVSMVSHAGEARRSLTLQWLKEPKPPGVQRLAVRGRPCRSMHSGRPACKHIACFPSCGNNLLSPCSPVSLKA